MELKALKDLDLKQQLLFIESYLPGAWDYLNDIGDMLKLPQFDDNDEIIQPRNKVIQPRKKEDD
jgi:hypothetical protein